MTTVPALVLVAGGAAAGKTLIGRALARALPDAALLDKDVMAAGWIDAMLARLNAGIVDRDSPFYWQELRPLEYASLLAVCFDNLRAGKHVIAIAPFGPELRDRLWLDMAHARAREAGGRLKVIWVATDSATAQARMRDRGEVRDGWKLGNWNTFAGTAPYAPPPGEMLVLDNRAGAAPDDLVEQALHYIAKP